MIPDWASALDPEELDRLAQSLRAAKAAAAQRTIVNQTRLVRCAEALLKARANRAAQFGAISDILFGEAGYGILLDLYVQRACGRDVSVSSACHASTSPATTALRHIGVLEAHGFVMRNADPFDARRSYIRLSGEAVQRVEAHLREILVALELPGVQAG